MKKNKLNLRNKIVRASTYLTIFIGAQYTVLTMFYGLVEKLFM